jgi:hypothetical protein
MIVVGRKIGYQRSKKNHTERKEQASPGMSRRMDRVDLPIITPTYSSDRSFTRYRPISTTVDCGR